MKPIVSIIMGSTSDLPVLEKAAKLFDEFEIPFELNALSAHRTPEEVTAFATSAQERGLKVIIAAAGMAAHLPGVIAAQTTVPVIGVPIKSTLEGMDALLAIVQMPPGIPVATVGINGGLNAAILAIQMLALSDEKIAAKLEAYKKNLAKKIVKANEELSRIEYKFKTNKFEFFPLRLPCANQCRVICFSGYNYGQLQLYPPEIIGRRNRQHSSWR